MAKRKKKNIKSKNMYWIIGIVVLLAVGYFYFQGSQGGGLSFRDYHTILVENGYKCEVIRDSIISCIHPTDEDLIYNYGITIEDYKGELKEGINEYISQEVLTDPNVEISQYKGFDIYCIRYESSDRWCYSVFNEEVFIVANTRDPLTSTKKIIDLAKDR